MSWFKKTNKSANDKPLVVPPSSSGQNPSSSTFYLDKPTVLRYLQNLYNISRLVYSGPTGALPGLSLSTTNIPLDTVWFAVLIPQKPIPNFDQLLFKDFKYFLLTGESLGHKKGTMFLVFDFDTPPTKTALGFPFIYAEDVEWLRMLVKVKRLSIYPAPDGLPSQAMTLEFEHESLKPVENWLATCAI